MAVDANKEPDMSDSNHDTDGAATLKRGIAGGAGKAFAALKDALQPPQWVVSEVQNRVVLFLNHVLMQEPQAQERLRRQVGKKVRVSWGDIYMVLSPTPAGLVELAEEGGTTDLKVTVNDDHPLQLLKTLASGERPGVDIQGDVQLAAEVAWLVDNVKWDLEEDLSRILGDAPAHTIAGVGRKITAGLRSFLAGSARPGETR